MKVKRRKTFFLTEGKEKEKKVGQYRCGPVFGGHISALDIKPEKGVACSSEVVDDHKAEVSDVSHELGAERNSSVQ